MFAIFWRTVRDRKISLIIYSILGILLLAMYLSFFPAIQEQAQSLQELMKSYPESFLKAFGMEDMIFNNLESYLSTEQFSFMWPLLMILLLVSFSGSAIAREIERGTAEILLALPVSRLKIFFAKYFAGFFNLIVFVLASIPSTILLAKLYGVEYKSEGYIIMSLLGFMFALATYSFSMLMSVLFSEKGKVYFSSAGLIVIMYVLNIISSLKDSVSDLKYFSFFYYFNAGDALVRNHIDHFAYWIFLGVAVLSTVLAAVWFSRRDIAV